MAANEYPKIMSCGRWQIPSRFWTYVSVANSKEEAEARACNFVKSHTTNVKVTPWKDIK